MGDIAIDGLLSDDLSSLREKYRADYKQWFDLCTDVNREVQRALLGIEADQYDMEALLITTLYLRIIETFQAVVILAERGIMHQCRMLIRCMLDAAFPLVAISKDETHSLFKEYIQQDIFDPTFRTFRSGFLQFIQEPFCDA